MGTPRGPTEGAWGPMGASKIIIMASKLSIMASTSKLSMVASKIGIMARKICIMANNIWLGSIEQGGIYDLLLFMCVFILFLRLFCSSLRCLPSECKNLLDPASPALGVLYPSTPNCSTPICCNPKRCGSRCCRPSSVLHQPPMHPASAFSTSNRWWSSNSVPGSLGILVERFL